MKNQILFTMLRYLEDPNASKEEMHKAIIEVIEYRIKYEIQESKDRKDKWTAPPDEIRQKVQSLDLSQNGEIIDSFTGASSYVVVLIPQIHEYNGETSPEVEECQRNISKIISTLFDQGITNIQLLERPNTDMGEMSIISAPQYFKSYPNEHHVQEELKRGLDLHTFGIEDGYNKQVEAMLCAMFIETFSNQFYETSSREKLREMQGKGELTKQFFIELAVKDAERLTGNKPIEKAVQFLSQMADKTFGDQPITVEINDFLQYRDNAQEVFDDVAVDKRNKIHARNIEMIHNNTLANSMVLVMGSGHFKRDQGLNQRGRFIDPIQHHLQSRGISYITILPKPLSVKQNYSALEK
ncbi:MAG: hypothetical protein H6767_01285 [Candidatus Peribacteria bacterium]|nr:MAG: hypothetical protein H6767_01285 [Candidatus Peribacteria bacterium]